MVAEPEGEITSADIKEFLERKAMMKSKKKSFDVLGDVPAVL
jgi:hypothetical protein